MINLVVNGNPVEFDADPGTPLLWALRDHLGLTGTKFGCGVGACGACTVHLDDQPARSCVLPLATCAGRKVVTIEGLRSHDALHPVQRAWIEAQAPQCGYCQSGMIMAVAAFLKRKPDPTDREIDDAITNICRCGAYPRVRRAIHAAAAATKP